MSWSWRPSKESRRGRRRQRAKEWLESWFILQRLLLWWQVAVQKRGEASEDTIDAQRRETKERRMNFLQDQRGGSISRLVLSSSRLRRHPSKLKEEEPCTKKIFGRSAREHIFDMPRMLIVWALLLSEEQPPSPASRSTSMLNWKGPWRGAWAHRKKEMSRSLLYAGDSPRKSLPACPSMCFMRDTAFHHRDIIILSSEATDAF